VSNRSVRSIPSILVVIAVLIAACAPNADADPGTAATPAPSEPLDCTTGGYPCTWSDVVPDIAERSRALGREAASRAAADAMPAVASWLENQDGVTSVTEGDGVIRFMLEGGRPVWVATGSMAGEVARTASLRGQLASAGDPLFGRPATADATGSSGLVRSGPLQSVVGEDREAKKAIVLAPFGYIDSMDAGEIAGLLGDTRGYEGNVTYLENVTQESTNVDVDTFANLDGNDVIYLKSVGGTTKPNDEEPAHSFIAIRDVPPEFHITDAQNVGLDIVTFQNGAEALAVTADFFRHLYPGGLQNSLIFLDVNWLTDKTLRWSDKTLIWYIKGRSSELYTWDGGVDAAPARAAITEFIEDLSSTGRTSEVVYHEMAAQLVVGRTKLVGYIEPGQPGLRIRETAWLRNPDDGGPLANGDEIAIVGELGDGEPDTVKWIVDIDGVFGEEPEHTSMAIYIDTLEAGSELVADLKQIDDYTFRAEGEFELPYDLEEGAQLSLEAIVNLPEGGPSRHSLTVEVTDETDIGRIWKGEASVTADTLWQGVTLTKTATVEFTRDRHEKPDATKVTFNVTAGSMTWTMAGGDGKCSYVGGPVTVPLTQGDHGGGLTFDLTKPGAVTYSGHAGVASGPEIQVMVDCAGLDRSFITRADGEVWKAPMDLVWVMDGPEISGSYRMDAQITGTYDWTFTKVK
jgi:hypothetical protein